MSEWPTPGTAAPPRLTSDRTRRTWGRGPDQRLGSDDLAATLTDLASMEWCARAILGRGGLDPAVDHRLAGVIAELESIIHDVLEGARAALNDAPRPEGREPGVAAAAGWTPVEAAFLGWLDSRDMPNLVQVEGVGGPAGSATEMLRDLVLSGRELPAEFAAAVGMPPGTTFGYVAAELLLAVTDPAGPRCLSYRSAVRYLRDRDDPVDRPSADGGGWGAAAVRP